MFRKYKRSEDAKAQASETRDAINDGTFEDTHRETYLTQIKTLETELENIDYLDPNYKQKNDEIMNKLNMLGNMVNAGRSYYGASKPRV